MFARNNNRSNEREIKTNFVFKLSKLNFYTVKYCDVEL